MSQIQAEHARGIPQSAFRNPHSALKDVVPGQIVVGYQPGLEADARRLVEAHGATVLKRSQAGGDFIVAGFPTFGVPRDPSWLRGESDAGMAIKTQELLAVCHQSPVVRYAEPVFRCRICWTPNDPFYSSYQWDKWVLYSDRAWNRTTGSLDIKVAVVDEGVDYRHPDLSAQFDPGLKGYDFVDNDNDPYPVSADESHATHVAGIIAASLNNSVGVAGWANVTLYSVRALDSSGSGTHQDIADGIRWAADHGARVINLSLGSTDASAVMQQAVDYAWGKGALVIAASGNEGTSGVFYPAAYPNAIAVGALAPDGSRATFSNWGPELALIAPGENIYSTIPFNRYESFAGTSMASPQVAGVAALLLSYKPSLSNAVARAILEASAIDIWPSGRDAYSGFGLVNPERALQLAALMSGERVSALKHESPMPQIVRFGQTIDLPARAPFRIYDAQGRVVLSQDCRDCPYSQGITIDFGPGVYFVHASGQSPLKVTVVR